MYFIEIDVYFSMYQHLQQILLASSPPKRTIIELLLCRLFSMFSVQCQSCFDSTIQHLFN